MVAPIAEASRRALARNAGVGAERRTVVVREPLPPPSKRRGAAEEGDGSSKGGVRFTASEMVRTFHSDAAERKGGGRTAGGGGERKRGSCGLGASMQRDSAGRFFLKTTKNGGRSARAGGGGRGARRVELLSIDGRPVKGLTERALARLVVGAEGSVAELVVRDAQKEWFVAVTRSASEVSSDDEGGVGLFSEASASGDETVVSDASSAAAEDVFDSDDNSDANSGANSESDACAGGEFGNLEETKSLVQARLDTMQREGKRAEEAAAAAETKRREEEAAAAQAATAAAEAKRREEEESKRREEAATAAQAAAAEAKRREEIAAAAAAKRREVEEEGSLSSETSFLSSSLSTSLSKSFEDVRTHSIGVVFAEASKGLKVRRFSSSAAAQLLALGDVITHINGQNVTSMSQSQVSKELIGPIGSTVALTVLRDGAALVMDVPRVPRDQKGDVKEEAKRKKCGIGVSLKNHKGAYVVSRAVAECPLVRGDEILRLGDVLLQGLGQREAMDAVMGEEGSEAIVTVRRGGVEKTMRLTRRPGPKSDDA